MDQKKKRSGPATRRSNNTASSNSSNDMKNVHHKRHSPSEVFKAETGTPGWFNTGLIARDPWTKEVYDSYWKERAGEDHVVKYDKDSVKAYRAFLVRAPVTPGTAAGVELYVRSFSAKHQPFLSQYASEWDDEEEDTTTDSTASKGKTPQLQPAPAPTPAPTTTTPFEDAMMQMAICSTKLSLALLERWRRWCEACQKPRSAESFEEFAKGLPKDTNLTSSMLERMHFFSSAFTQIYDPAPPIIAQPPPPPQLRPLQVSMDVFSGMEPLGISPSASSIGNISILSLDSPLNMSGVDMCFGTLPDGSQSNNNTGGGAVATEDMMNDSTDYMIPSALVDSEATTGGPPPPPPPPVISPPTVLFEGMKVESDGPKAE